MQRSIQGKDMLRTEEKIATRLPLLAAYIYRHVLPVEDIRYQPGHAPNGQGLDLDDASWQRIAPGYVWGDEPNSYGWFRLRVGVPGDWAGRRVALDIDPGGVGSGGFKAECLAWVNGAIRQGVDRNHNEIRLADEAEAGAEYLVALEAFTGVRLKNHQFQRANLVAIDEPTHRLYWHLKVAHEALSVMDESALARHRLLTLLDDTVRALDLTFCDVPLDQGLTDDPFTGEAKYPDSERFYSSVRRALELFESRFAREFTPCDREKVLMVGHAHIDVGWLWEVAQSRKKVGRTFSTVLDLMERYPDYHFFQSQPVLYQFTKEDYPDLYARIQERVQDGRWEANGATWVEMDTNIPSGESLVRQFLFGKRFFRQEFGYDARVLWLPDVFGYSWSLPQIMKKSGVDYFMTTKISWNEYNEIPFDIFQWRGVDGSEVLTQFITTVSGHWFYTYNGDLRPEQVKSAWTNFKGKGKTDEVMLSFGWGDGGGGPTAEMLENAKRLEQFPELPAARMGRIDNCFGRVAAQAKDLHVWNGELYFEFHRGTYTTQARMKKDNRTCENLFHDAELLATLAWLKGQPYPHEALNGCWRTVLTNQFHDILPGSSIREVYLVAARESAEVQQKLRDIRDGALRRLLGEAPSQAQALAVVNTTSFARDDVLDLPATAGGFADGDTPCPVQDVQALDGTPRSLVGVQAAPPKGWKVLTATPGRFVGASSLRISARVLESRFFRLELDEHAEIRSLVDKRVGREVLPAGQTANQLLVFEDRPLNSDAWNVDIFYGDKFEHLRDIGGLAVVEEGPVRGAVEVTRRFGRSSLRQRICLYDAIPRIDLQTEVDWQERKRMLKAAFPVDIHSTQATYEIQFGAITRPTHWNTSWDWARFEVCAQRWADLSEGDYGVSLLNDCKYGYDVKDNVMRISLLRGPVEPDSVADLGVHTFTYALYPHAEDWSRAGTPRAAEALNRPLLGVPMQARAGESTKAFVTVDRDDVVVETIKKAEDRDELVLRLYENANRRGVARLTFARPVLSVRELDLMETPLRLLKADERTVWLEFKPYEIVTLGVVLGA
ncbi:MAG: alpha-mannosidase [Anaerolineae bacterium]